MPNHAQEDFRAALDRAMTLALGYLDSLPDRPVSRTPDMDVMTAALSSPFPDAGCPPDEAVAEWFRRAEVGIVASPGPRFFGFVNGGTLPAAMAGDWLASAIDQNAGLWLSSPAAVQTETVVLDWLKDLFGLPMAWSGALTSGATMANLVGLAAARQWAGTRLGFDPSRDGLAGNPAIPVVSSTEIHASARKCLATLGLGRGRTSALPAPGGAVEIPALEEELGRHAGPVIVIANAGEVNSGAFDSLAEVADCCERHPGGAWLHVDGAFGLFAAASPRYRGLVAGIERADSVASDGHKWLNVPYDSGFAFVRDREMLRAAFTVEASYLTPAAGAPWDPYSHVPEMSRRFRGLAAWCALRSMGRAGYREIVERCAANAAEFAAWVERQPGLELVAPAPLNIVCFRLTVPDRDPAAQDEANRSAVSLIQKDGRAFVTGTFWRDRAAIRAAFDNWMTTPDDVRMLQQVVSDAAARVSG
ncbi:MAG: pyridoxal phosphate-dependent decarboxylase family protein [Chloroflexota bacterium]